MVCGIDTTRARKHIFVPGAGTPIPISTPSPTSTPTPSSEPLVLRAPELRAQKYDYYLQVVT